MAIHEPEHQHDPHHEEGHSHHDHHGHHHHHFDEDASPGRIATAFFLNFFFSLIEFVGGFLTNSTAIMANAIHDMGDAFSIALGWGMARLAPKGANERFTYGYRRFTLLGALVTGTVLVVGSCTVLWQAIPRLWSPEQPHAGGMIGLAIVGLAVNTFAAWKLSQGHSMNERMLNLHLLEDVLGWAVTLIVGITLHFTDWAFLDPLLSILVTLFILYNVLRNLQKTFNLFLQGTPDPDLSAGLHEQLLAVAHVHDVHHLRLWSLDGERHVLTAHVVLDEPITSQLQRQVKADIVKTLTGHRLAHTTIEFEEMDEACRDHTLDGSADPHHPHVTQQHA